MLGSEAIPRDKNALWTRTVPERFFAHMRREIESAKELDIIVVVCGYYITAMNQSDCLILATRFIMCFNTA